MAAGVLSSDVDDLKSGRRWYTGWEAEYRAEVEVAVISIEGRRQEEDVARVHIGTDVRYSVANSEIIGKNVESVRYWSCAASHAKVSKSGITEAGCTTDENCDVCKSCSSSHDCGCVETTDGLTGGYISDNRLSSVRRAYTQARYGVCRREADCAIETVLAESLARTAKEG